MSDKINMDEINRVIVAGERQADKVGPSNLIYATIRCHVSRQGTRLDRRPMREFWDRTQTKAPHLFFIAIFQSETARHF